MQYKEQCAKAENSSAAAKELIEKATNDFANTKQPIYLAFSGVGNLFMAKHVFNPISKMSYFKKGKTELDKAIQLQPKNVEIRFYRLLSQTEMPKILGYYENIEEDKTFIKNNFQDWNDEVLKKEIKKYLKL